MLRTTLEAENILPGINDAKVGSYVTFSGIGLSSRPNFFDDMHRERLRGYPELYESLDAERVRERRVRGRWGDRTRIWILTIMKDTSLCAAFLDGRWLADSYAHWVYNRVSVTDDGEVVYTRPSSPGKYLHWCENFTRPAFQCSTLHLTLKL